MFNKKKHRIEALEHELKVMTDERLELARKVDYYKSFMDRVVTGQRCTGNYCEHCDHYGGERIETRNGHITLVTATCLKDVPCPEFKRRGSPRPNKQEGGPKPHD